MPKGIKGFQKGHHPKNEIKKGQHGKEHPMFGKKQTKEWKKKLKERMKGNKYSLGVIASKETRIKKSEVKKGKNHWNWQGGKTSENHRIRGSIEIRLWRESVFARDNWACQKCENRNGKGKAIILHSHHIKNFAEIKELQTSIENGITLCKKCHKQFHKIYGYTNNNESQLKEFLSIASGKRINIKSRSFRK